MTARTTYTCQMCEDSYIAYFLKICIETAVLFYFNQSLTISEFLNELELYKTTIVLFFFDIRSIIGNKILQRMKLFLRGSILQK